MGLSTFSSFSHRSSSFSLHISKGQGAHPIHCDKVPFRCHVSFQRTEQAVLHNSSYADEEESLSLAQAFRF